MAGALRSWSHTGAEQESVSELTRFHHLQFVANTYHTCIALYEALAPELLGKGIQLAFQKRLNP